MGLLRHLSRFIGAKDPVLIQRDPSLSLRINGLLDMGIKPVYRLTTSSGRSIKTTANHPYYAKIRNSKLEIRNKSEIQNTKSETGKWIKISGLKAGDEIACPSGKLARPEARRGGSFGGVPNGHVFQWDVYRNRLRQEQQLVLHKLRLSFPYLTSSFLRMNKKGDKDRNYSQNAKNNPQFRRELFKEICSQSYSQHGFANIYNGFLQ